MKLAPTLPALLLLVAAAGTAGGKSPVPASFDPERITWTRLDFRATKLFLTARTVVRLRSVGAAESAARWIEPGRGAAVGPAGPRVMEVAIESSVAGRESSESVWFNPRRADALQRLKVRRGKKGYRKVARFTDEGTFVLRTAPIDREEAVRPFAEWTNVEKYFYPHPAGNGCRVVSEPAALFYILSAGSLPAGRTRRHCVFSGKNLIPLAVENQGLEAIAVDYSEQAAGKTTRRSGMARAWKMALRPLADGEEFEILGLEGDVEIFIDKKSRVPLEVRGRIGGLGRVAVRLTAVEMLK